MRATVVSFGNFLRQCWHAAACGWDVRTTSKNLPNFKAVARMAASYNREQGSLLQIAGQRF